MKNKSFQTTARDSTLRCTLNVFSLGTVVWLVHVQNVPYVISHIPSCVTSFHVTTVTQFCFLVFVINS